MQNEEKGDFMKKILVFLLVFLLFAAGFLKSEKTLFGLLHLSEEDIWKCNVMELYDNGEMWQDKGDAADEDEIREIMDRLRKTKVFFRQWKWNVDLQEGETVYDLLLFDGGKHWLRFYESGEVHILCLGYWIFRMEEADASEWFAFLQGLL